MFCDWLPRQGSNLESSDPESDVLPITPRGNFPMQQAGRTNLSFYKKFSKKVLFMNYNVNYKKFLRNLSLNFS